MNLTAIEDKVKAAMGGGWSTVVRWNPEQRYNPRGTYTAIEAANMVSATKRALEVIL